MTLSSLVIILVAGEGRRLAPLTRDRPKCLVPVGGRPFLERSLEALKRFSVRDVCLVSGYRGDQIARLAEHFSSPFKIHICQNTEYDQTNNAYSLWAALRGKKDQPFLLMDGDLLFEERLLAKLANDPRENLMVVDDDPAKLTKEAMKVVFDAKDFRILDISKEIPMGRAGGEYIGMAKFSAEWMILLKKKLQDCVSRKEGTQWYYEDVLKSLLEEGPALNALPTGGLSWAEVDTPEDLEDASRTWK